MGSPIAEPLVVEGAPNAAPLGSATALRRENVVSSWLGGRWYEQWSVRSGDRVAFAMLVGVGALFTAGCWVLWPVLRQSTAVQPRPLAALQ